MNSLAATVASAVIAPSIPAAGRGMVPVTATLGSTTWRSALWPKDGSYLVPLRDSVRRAERVDLGDVVTVHLTIAV